MSSETKQPAAELLNTQTNADGENTNKENSALIEVESIENCPFSLVGNEEHGYFIGFGKYRLTEREKDKQSALEWLDDSNKWDMIVRIIFTCMQMDVDKNNSNQ